MPVWWCEQLGTVLANEEVVEAKRSRGYPVVRKPMRQWMLRITAYAERLLDDLETIDWSRSLKEMQRNWIGRSEGAEWSLKFWGQARSQAAGKAPRLHHPAGHLVGATYMVLAPEHPLVERLFAIAEEWERTTPANQSDVAEKRVRLNAKKAPWKLTRQEVAKKSDLERTELAKEKTGVFTGAYAINPVHGGKFQSGSPINVLVSYGTGAIMAVPVTIRAIGICPQIRFTHRPGGRAS